MHGVKCASNEVFSCLDSQCDECTEAVIYIFKGREVELRDVDVAPLLFCGQSSHDEVLVVPAFGVDESQRFHYRQVFLDCGGGDASYVVKFIHRPVMQCGDASQAELEKQGEGYGFLNPLISSAFVECFPLQLHSGRYTKEIPRNFLRNVGGAGLFY